GGLERARRAVPLRENSTFIRVSYRMKHLVADFGIGAVEIEFPVFAVLGYLPEAGNSASIRAERAGEALIETGIVAPLPPNAIAQAHLIEARDATRVRVEHGVGVQRVIAANNAVSNR